ncbi:MAG: phosphoribosylglycinamide formyltransferase [Candidatus Peribacteraceae bacterium]
MRIVALSSSRGTTFQAILDARARGEIRSEIIGLVTDRADRGCIEKAKTAGIPVTIVAFDRNETREAFALRVEEAVRTLAGETTDDVVLAAVGWMWIFPPDFTSRWKVINVHPALLPKHGGPGMYGHHVHDAVLAAHEKKSGVTIHLMDGGVDSGKILLQKTCSVQPYDTAATLQAKVQELEKEWYPKVLSMIESGSLKI